MRVIRPSNVGPCGRKFMKIAILSRNPRLYSTRRLVEAGEARGHEMHVIDTLKCYMDITPGNPTIWYMGEKLEGFDAVIPRIGASVTHYGLAVIRQFEMTGVYCLTESVALGRSRDKLRALQLLSRKGLGLPRTSFAYRVHNTKDLIKLVGGPPLVVKLCEGTQGRGIVLAETKEAGGSDIRCLVIGGKVVAAMQRTAMEGEFRSNLHRGGTAKLVKLTPVERRTAVKAAQTMGLHIAGVDILRSTRGPLVMEVNSSPGLEGIEGATQKDVAGAIIQFVEDNARPNKTRTRGKG